MDFLIFILQIALVVIVVAILLGVIYVAKTIIGDLMRRYF